LSYTRIKLSRHLFILYPNPTHISTRLSGCRCDLHWSSDLLDTYTHTHTTRDYTLQITITQRVVISVTVFTALLGSVSQQWTFLCSRAHVLAGWRSSHTNLLLFKLPSQDCLVRAPSPLYVASVRTAQKTPLPTVTPLLVVAQPLPSNGCFCGSTVVAFSKYATTFQIVY
jgi:hypothetical protein